jgi:hypothetical protein
MNKENILYLVIIILLICNIYQFYENIDIRLKKKEFQKVEEDFYEVYLLQKEEIEDLNRELYFCNESL